jgi:hypothetical protein
MSNQGNMSEGERKRSCVAVQLIRVAASRWLLSTRALASSLCSTPPPPQSRCGPATWRGRVERRKEVAAARVLGAIAIQGAGAGTQRGGV